ncbi:helix-turn-helix domain-containing protein [Enterobacter bugandensis]|uniref:helix-turn-helix domain-containing protein n=1 Tax=Enterobacter bugandensis TaxID=881260 RepID=UPI0021D0B83A|nr:helix-turn-helix transcriptional regulator [Enterobacter bugandensis]MCU6216513.1 helix-turn-helix domain-containing protein [Enterobacter bugandensis]
MTPEYIKKTFGDRMKKRRIERGLSQEELALTAGLDRTYISSVERGKRNISLVNIYKISTALNIDVKDLF